jgi:hypothetical protein
MIHEDAYCSVAVSCPGGTVREETMISTEKCQARVGTLGVVYKHVDKCRNITLYEAFEVLRVSVHVMVQVDDMKGAHVSNNGNDVEAW